MISRRGVWSRWYNVARRLGCRFDFVRLWLAEAFIPCAANHLATVTDNLDALDRWWERQPVPVRILSFPVVGTVMTIHSVLVIIYFVVAVLPYIVVTGWNKRRLFKKRLRDRGRLMRWQEAQPQIEDGRATLVVEMSIKGPGCSWLIDRPRSEVDPDHVAPSWSEYGMAPDAPANPWVAPPALNQWTLDRLGAFETSAHAVFPSARQLCQLREQAQQHSVLAVSCYCEGTITHRFVRAASGPSEAA
jgi:hypothetical protein